MITLEEITFIHAPIERCFDLARSVEVHLAGNVHWGEAAIATSEGVTAGVTTGLLDLGQRVTWQARHFGIRQKLTSEITAMKRPTYFQDSMIRGAFAFMEHEHIFRAVSGEITEMRDLFYFSAPLAGLGRLAEELVLRRYMQKLLRERNRVIQQIAEGAQWKTYLPVFSERR